MGGSGADRLDGNRNDDVLSGGAGRDTLIGGVGDDTLYGGLGLDQFHFADGSGQDVIVDRPRFGERLYIGRDINGTGVRPRPICWLGCRITPPVRRFWTLTAVTA
ncbi:MAG: hypothetical protein VXX53_03160 [Pseudomonadota bacterium]|nr:hypothetical protein [Pseudomonadota bacterium]